jgi:hypothetical protein
MSALFDCLHAAIHKQNILISRMVKGAVWTPIFLAKTPPLEVPAQDSR